MEKGSFRGILSTHNNSLIERCKDGVKHFSTVCTDSRRSKHQKPKARKLKLNTKKYSFTVREVKHRNRLLRVVIDSPFLENLVIYWTWSWAWSLSWTRWYQKDPFQPQLFCSSSHSSRWCSHPGVPPQLQYSEYYHRIFGVWESSCSFSFSLGINRVPLSIHTNFVNPFTFTALLQKMNIFDTSKLSSNWS